MTIREELLRLQNEKNAAFVARLIPNIPPERILGAYTPQLRALAKRLRGSAEAEAFLQELPHGLLEENAVHAFLLEGIRDYDRCLAEVERFLPHVDNWATCDSLRPPVFQKHRAQLLPVAEKWLASGETYTVRYGLGMLLSHYLDGDFSPRILELAAAVRSEEYYVRMMQAWFFAEALAKRYEAALPYLEQGKLDPWTHNKAIQKARESRRVSDERKAFLNTLKIRG